MRGDITCSEAGKKGGLARGKQLSGEGNGNHKLTWSAVETIRKTRQTRAVELARRYGVHPNRIWAIWRGEAWRR